MNCNFFICESKNNLIVLSILLQRKTYVYKYIHYSQREISDNNRISSWRPNTCIDTLTDILERLTVNLHCEQTISFKKKAGRIRLLQRLNFLSLVSLE